MISLKEVLAELKSESLNENVAGDGNNYCLFSSNYCLFSSPETPSQPDDEILIEAPSNLCIV